MKDIPSRSLEELIVADCRQKSGFEAGQDFASRRMFLRAWVTRIVVRTIRYERPKVAHVFVDYIDGEQRTFRFTKGIGVAL